MCKRKLSIKEIEINNNSIKTIINSKERIGSNKSNKSTLKKEITHYSLLHLIKNTQKAILSHFIHLHFNLMK